MEKKILEQIVYSYKDELNFPFNEILEKIGFEALYFLVENYGGSSLYLPTTMRMFRSCLAKEILKEFNGDNYRQLSRKYSIPVRSLQIMVEKGRNV